jgi:transcriptional regulator with XRE-family HTH domain
MAQKQLNRIKIMLLEKGRTSRELAAHLGKTEITISRWATNTAQPSLETLFAIAKYLDVNVCELLVNNKK